MATAYDEAFQISDCPLGVLCWHALKLLANRLACTPSAQIGQTSFGGGEKQGKRGWGAASKTPFVAAIQTNSEGRPYFMRLTPVAGLTHKTLKQWSAESLASTAHVLSDGLWCFEAVIHTTAQH